MKVNRIVNPLPGERVVASHPKMSPSVETDWRRRLNLYTGRSLSDAALTTEQTGRAGRLATRGQVTSPGIVTGLEVIAEEESGGGKLVRHLLNISPGLAVTASGEDMFIPGPLRLEIKKLRVYRPETDSLDDTLEELIDKAAPLPHAMIVLLQPLAIERTGEFDPDDPCELDPENFAFEDRQTVDGSRLMLYAWPTDRLPLPGANKQWRNRIAYAIFGAEKNLEPSQLLPWEETGVPLALIGFNDKFAPLFVDRHAVARAGGKPRRRSMLIEKSGNAFIWQARVQQFGEQLVDSQQEGEKIEEIARHFRYLPPVGLLPKEAISVREERQFFFPSSYTVEAVPVPLEQLDVVMDASASLLPYDTSAGDAVRVLVPVPQVWYEPRLLLREEIAIEFYTTLEKFIEHRADLLQRRAEVREKAKALIKAKTGKLPEYPDPDPESLEDDEDVASGTIDPAEEDYGTVLEGKLRRVTVIEKLIQELKLSASLKGRTFVRFLPEPAVGQIQALHDVTEKIGYDFNRKAFVFQGAMSEEELQKLLNAPGSPYIKVMINDLFVRSQKDALSQLDLRGLEGFIAFLEQKIESANDKMDVGFLRLQTDIYRFRQLMLGNMAATRLATSPIIASIAQGESAVASRKDLNDFINLTKMSGTVITGFENDLLDLDQAGPPEGALGASKPGGMSAPPPQSKFFISKDIDGASISNVNLAVEADFEVSKTKTSAKKVTSQSASSGQLFGNKPVVKEDVIGKAPIVGKAYDFRSITVAERIKEPPAPEAKSFSVASKYEVLRILVELSEELDLDDLMLPGFYEYNANGVPVIESIPIRDARGDVIGERKVAKETRLSIFDIKYSDTLKNVLADKHDFDPADGDESAFFASGIRALDHTAAMLRIVEGRIQNFRRGIELSKEALEQLNELISGTDTRLKALADDLAEARHDVAVARALLAEEDARVQAINQRRAVIFAEHVQFLAFHRPRTQDLLQNAPVRGLDPGLIKPPVPACLEQHSAVPAELRAMVDLLRESPVKWFVNLPQLLDLLDRIEYVQQTVLTAKVRAQVQPAMQLAKQLTPVGFFGQAIQKVFATQQQTVVQYRSQVAQINLSAFAGTSWKTTRDQARDVVSIGDLIDASHGRSDLAQRAARELDNIARVAACLHADFNEVPPAVRLTWAERLSQYDEPINLRNLSSLPRWGERDASGKDLIGFIERRTMQTLVDWLYSRVDVREPEAVAFISDLVRICILLASHAPVNQIISGHVARPTIVTKNAIVDLAVGINKVRIGMHALIYSSANQVLARGVVEDLSGANAYARVVQVFKENAQIEANARVQFAEPDALDRKPQKR